MHLKAQKVFCCRSASVLEIPLVKSMDKQLTKSTKLDNGNER